MQQEEQLKIIADLADKFDTKGQAEELVAIVESIIEIFASMKVANETERKNMMALYHSQMDKMEIMHERMTEDGKKIIQNLVQKIENKLSEIKSGDKGEDGHTPTEQELLDLIIPRIPAPINGSPDSPTDILKKVQSLEEGERWRIQDVNGLEEELKRLGKKAPSSFVAGGGNGLAIKNAVMVHDLSSSLNGVLKTFSLPAFYRILSVQLSSYPNTLRPTVDYTVNGSTFQITFTDEIPADSSLATGQTCIILYVS